VFLVGTPKRREDAKIGGRRGWEGCSATENLKKLEKNRGEVELRGRAKEGPKFRRSGDNTRCDGDGDRVSKCSNVFSRTAGENGNQDSPTSPGKGGTQSHHQTQ